MQLNFFSVTGWSIGLDYRDIEWLALETNRDHFVVFEIASKYCISDSFVDYDGYSISSKGFLQEKLPCAQGQGQRLCFAGAAVKRYPTSKVRETQVRR